MHTIGIISDIHDWHSDQIELYLKKKNCRVLRINFDDLVVSLKEINFSFLMTEKSIN